MKRYCVDRLTSLAVYSVYGIFGNYNIITTLFQFGLVDVPLRSMIKKEI